MAGHHKKRVEDQIRRVLSDAIQRRLRDPRLEMVTVTSVELSDDLRHGRAHLSIMGGEPEIAAVLDTLRRASGRLRSEIAHAVRLRHAPEIQYVHDDMLSAQARIEDLLRRDRSGEGPDEDNEKDGVGR